jgi:chaperone BCS1
MLREEGCDHFNNMMEYVVRKVMDKSINQVELTNPHLSSFRFINTLSIDSSFSKNLYIPLFGTDNSFIFRGKRIYLSSFTMKADRTEWNRNRVEMRRITFWMYGQNMDFLKDFIEHVIEEHKKEYDDCIKVSRARHMSEMWKVPNKVPGRKKDTVFLPETMMEDILGDIKEFSESKDWYQSKGIPYRRGYLFYGPPGTGKTSTIRSVAYESGRTMRVMNMASPFISDDILQCLISGCGEDDILVIEDVDAVFKDDDEDVIEERNRRIEEEPKTRIERHFGLSRKKIKNSPVTLSGLLNALDGVDSSEGFITIMTSNFPDRLDDALVRPGRVDKKYAFGYPDDDQIRRMYTLFFPEGDQKHYFADAILSSEKRLSMATIQGYLIASKDSGGDRDMVDKLREEIADLSE